MLVQPGPCQYWENIIINHLILSAWEIFTGTVRFSQDPQSIRWVKPEQPPVMRVIPKTEHWREKLFVDQDV